MELTDLLQRIAVATPEEIDDLLPALIRRKEELYPDWVIQYRAWKRGNRELPWNWPLEPYEFPQQNGSACPEE